MTPTEYNLLLSLADYIYASIQARDNENDLDQYNVACRELQRARIQFIKDYKKEYSENGK